MRQVLSHPHAGRHRRRLPARTGRWP